MAAPLRLRRSSFIIVIISLTLVCLLPMALPAQAATFAPGCTGGVGDAAALQASIVTAYSNGQPDTITLVSGCTYTVTASLSIFSDGGNLLTVNGNGATVNGNGAVRVFFIESGSNVSLNDLTVTAGNTSSSGGGIYAFGSTVILNRVTVSNNSASTGGGIYSAFGTTLTINDSFVTGNTAGRGGGIDTSISGIVTLNTTTLSGNTAGSDGGGINTFANLIVQGSIISGNTAGSDGGGIAISPFQSSPSVSVQGSIISGNNAGGTGGALHVVSLNSSIGGSCITDNSDVAVNASFPLNATGNWWGAANGPGPVGPGSGDTISTNVDFSGFLTTPPVGLNCAIHTFPTTTTLTSASNPSVFGQSVTFTATVTPTSGSGTPTGTVTFSIDSVPQAPVALDASGVATFTTSTLSAGSHTITADYNGDATFVASTSPQLTQVVNQDSTTTTVVSSVNPSNPGQSVTFTATVTPTSGSGTPTGTVSFFDGTTLLGAVPLAGGVAAFTTSSLSPGSHSVVAVYSGDAAFIANTSNTVDQQVLTPGISVSPTSGLVTSEAGGTASFSVFLGTQPTADVTINLASDDPSEGTVSPVALTFTSANWNVAQTATVTGVDDVIADGDVAYSIQTSVTSADAFYNALDPADVSVTNSDDDTAGISVSPTSGLITTEAGGTASFTVVLDTQPTADVTVNLASSDTSEGTVSPASFTFTVANWNTPQLATITGVDDAVVDGDVAYSIVTSVTSADAFYNALDPANVSVTNSDDDTASITASPVEFFATEGEIGSYQLALVTIPSVSPVVIRVSFDPAQVTVNGSTSPVDLTFTDQTAQTVTFQVATNSDANSDRNVFITQQVVSSGASEYPVGMNAPTVTIHIADVPPPPPTPLCEDHNFSDGGVVRSSTADALGYALNCRVLYQNGAPTQWLGSDLYNSGSIGIEGVLNLGVIQAIDIFSPAGMTYFQGGAVFCLRGTGTLIWLAASGVPRHAEIIGSYSVPEFPGFTCATLFEPGTLVLVRQNPLDRE